MAMKPAMSTLLPSMDRFRMQPTNWRLRTGKSSGRLGTPPRSRGPVRSRDLRRKDKLGDVGRRREGGTGPDTAVMSRGL